jgi:hypothetical protein
MIYTHVLNRGGLAVRSPLDQIDGSDLHAWAAKPPPNIAAPLAFASETALETRRV